MEITSENGHLAQRNTIKDIKGVTSASIMTVVEKTEKKWEEIWRGATSGRRGLVQRFRVLNAIEMSGQKMHARAKASIHTYMKGKKKIKNLMFHGCQHGLPAVVEPVKRLAVTTFSGSGDRVREL